ncbi:MAG: hypothetical protein H6842_15145 [Rhodospirillaceae bacterium]|nr:hypothetical protein [Rhodospirillaceae bacterium]
MRPLAFAAALLMSGGALAQDFVSPFTYTCGQLLSVETPEERLAANAMLLWAVGYMYGRFGTGESAQLDAGNYQQAFGDMVGAFNQVCPNVPDMPIAVFTENLANDFANALGQ